MANGIDIAASGLLAQQSRIDAIANDIANVNTPGYRSERIGFRDLLYSSEDGVAVGSGTATLDAGRSDVEGSIADSDNPLALAISGPGYFQVRRADGTAALTRAGDFQLDAAGSLVTATGERLVPPVTVPPGTQPADVTIASDGTVSASGKTVGKVSLVDVPAPAGLLALGSGDFAVTAASGAAAPAKGSTLLQGRLEQSDVDLVQSMTDLLDAQQSYSLASKALSTQDQLLQIANELRQ